jgi:hypothetical protein
MDPPVSAITRAWSGVIWRSVSGSAPRLRAAQRGVGEQEGTGGHLGRLLHRGLGGVGHVHHHAEPIAGADDLGAERGEAVVDHRPRLEIANVVRRVVHELHVTDAAPVRVLQPLELELEEVEPLHVHDDGGLPRRVGGLEVCRGEGAADAVTGHQLVHPGDALEVVLVELTGGGLADHGEHIVGVAPENRGIRHIGETDDGHAARSHALGEIAARRTLRRHPGETGMGVHVDGDVVLEKLPGRRHFPRRSGRGGLGTASRCRAAGEHGPR